MDVRPPNPRSTRSRVRGLATGLLAMAVAACGDGSGPTEPPPGSLPHMEVVAGGDQRGLAGYSLLAPVTVRVLDGEGRPSMGEVVRFEVVSGGGSVVPATRTVDTEGEASTSWRLGDAPGPQRIRAVVMADTTVAVDVDAMALGRDEVDLVVVHGALGPLTGFALIQPDGGGWKVILARPWSDTLLYVPPIPEAETGAVVFSLGNRPLEAWPAWTPGVDTVEVTLEPPVAVDVRFDVQVGSFQEQKQVMEDQLAAAQNVWSDQGAGLVLGDVTFQDSTDPARDLPVSSAGLCSGLSVGPEVSVTVVTSIDDGRYDGWGCWTGHIFLSLETRRFPRLLAHELGHTFTLVHTTTGLMYPSEPGSDLREGEIYRAHFDDQSVLNTIFASEPTELLRPCHASTTLVPRCLPEDLDFSRMAAVVAAGAVLSPDLPSPGPALRSAPVRGVDGIRR